MEAPARDGGEVGRSWEVVNWGFALGVVVVELDYSPRVSSASSGEKSTPGIVIVGEGEVEGSCGVVVERS